MTPNFFLQEPGTYLIFNGLLYELKNYQSAKFKSQASSNNKVKAKLDIKLAIFTDLDGTLIDHNDD